MRVLLSHSRGERGAAAILIACSTVIFTGILAFVTDFGMAYTNLRALQNGADAGALAAAREIVLKSSLSDSCATLKTTWTVPARKVAEAYFADNGTSGDAALTDFDIECSAQGLGVEVDTDQNSPVFFGKVFGATVLAVGQPAKTVVGPAGKIVGVRPYAVCDRDAYRIEQTPGVPHNVMMDGTLGHCGAAGNWGWLDLDGGSNGTDDVDGWINHGYSEWVSTSLSSCVTESPDCLETSPGVRAALESGLATLLGEDVFFPVFDEASGSGATARFHITGFLSARVCGFRLRNNGSITTGPCYSSSATDAPLNKRFVQLQFRRLVPVGQLNPKPNCMGDPECDFGVWVANLTE